MEYNFNISKTDKTLFITLEYQLSEDNAPKLLEELIAYKNEDIEEAVFDVTKLVYLSSSGIRVIMYIKNRFKNAPKIVFVNCAKDIRNVLDLVGFSSIIRFTEAESSDDDSTNEWQEKLAEMRRKDLEDYAARNSVVAHLMKMGQDDEEY